MESVGYVDLNLDEHTSNCATQLIPATRDSDQGEDRQERRASLTSNNASACGHFSRLTRPFVWR